MPEPSAVIKNATLALALCLTLLASTYANSALAPGDYPPPAVSPDWGPGRNGRKYFTVPIVHKSVNEGVESISDNPVTAPADNPTDTSVASDAPTEGFRARLQRDS